MNRIDGRCQVRLTWPAARALGQGGFYQVYGGIDQVNYSAPLNALPIPAWGESELLGGDGLVPDGTGPAGLDLVGVGDGLSPDGFGPDGFGTELRNFVTGPLIDGEWHFCVIATDIAGNAGVQGLPERVIVLQSPPQPPGVPVATVYSAADDELTLTWSLSPDDQDV